MEEKIRGYRDLVAWQRADALGLEVCRCTRDFPERERFGLASQVRRAGVSIASNIAEGYGRGSRSTPGSSGLPAALCSNPTPLCSRPWIHRS
jgi:hypothetical protein